MYIYNPNTYNYELMEQKNLTSDFVTLQVKYRESIEALFKRFYNFQKLDDLFIQLGGVPFNDKEYNFYHKYSTLGSQFVYLRNNYHIELLTETEIAFIRNCISNGTLLSDDFIKKTAIKVLLEKGNTICFNYVTLENFIFSKSFIFEFVYDVLACSSVAQIKALENLIKDTEKALKRTFKDELEIPIDGIVYTGSPDIFQPKETFNQII